MPQYFYGDGRLDGNRLLAGTGALGSIYFNADTSTFGTMRIGEAFGYAGDGTLRLDGGSNVTFEYQGAGTPAGGYGVGAGVGISGTTGDLARGSFEVTGGSSVAFNNYAVDDGNGELAGGYYNLNIGRRAGGIGDVEVSGVGSILTASGGAARITAGRDGGVGNLDITDGGVVGTFNLTIGRNGGFGITVVEGAGSELRLGFDYGFYGTNYTGSGSYSAVGREFNGRGILAMIDGGVTNIQNDPGVTDGAYLRFARDQHSFGYGLVSGAGSEFNLTQIGETATGTGANLTVGQGGRGILALEDNGALNLVGDAARIDVAKGRSGSVDALESQLVLRSGATVLLDSRDNGVATPTAATISVGSFQDAKGKLVVDGVGTTLTIISDNDTDIGSTPGTQNYGASLQIGDEGNGRLEVTNGGQIYIDGNDDVFPGFVIGNGRDSTEATSYALVSGAGSMVTLNGTRGPGTPYSNIGEAGFIGVGHRDQKTGTLAIRDGGIVANTGYNSASQIGGNTGSTGELIVDGSNSSFSGGDLLAVGADIDFLNAVFEFSNGGDGTLTLINGGVAGANLIGIGDTGTLNLGGSLTGDVVASGQINVGGDNSVAFGSVAGNVDALDGAIAFEAFDFASGDVDRLSITGTLDVDSDDLFVDLSGLGRSAAGDSAVLLDLGDTSNPDAPVASDFNILNTPTGVTASITQSGGQFTLNITAAPAKTVGFVGGDVSVIEGNPGDEQVVVLEIVRSGDLNTTLDIVVSVVAGTADLSDLEPGTPGAIPLSFGIGEDRILLPALIGEDDAFEGDETITAVITSAIAGDASPVSILNAETELTIIDDDLPVSFASSGAFQSGTDFNFFQVDPNATYLLVEGADTPVGDAVPIDLVSNGFAPDTLAFFETVGTMEPYGPGNGEFPSQIGGVFASSDTLLGQNYFDRVQDALTTSDVPGFYSLPGATYSTSTDIAEDFDIGRGEGTFLQIPSLSTHLFLTANDSFFSDNVDSNSDFGIIAFAPTAVGIGADGTLSATGYTVSEAALVVGALGGTGVAEFGDTRYDLTTTLLVGDQGGSGRVIIDQDSTFTVEDPGTYGVATDPSVEIGIEGGTGYVAVLGGSTLTAGSNFENLPDGSFQGGYNNIRIGHDRGIGALTVEGEGSLVEAVGTSNRIRLGFDNGHGELNIRDGGVVQTLTLTAGRRGGDALVLISGQGSLLHLTNEDGVYGSPQYAGSGGFSSIGRDYGSGFVRISDGGRILAENIDGVTDGVSVRLGRDYGSEGGIEIIGAGSGIDIIQHGAIGDSYASTAPVLDIGQGGQGELTLSGGADILVQGDSARLNVARGRDGLGASEASELRILSGSTVLVDALGYGTNEPTFDAYGVQIGTRNAGGRITIASDVNTNGSVLVDGAGSSLKVTTTSLQAGDYASSELTLGIGTGRLAISNGGYVGARELQAFGNKVEDGQGNVIGGSFIDVNSGGILTIDAPNNPDLSGDPENLPNTYRGIRVGQLDGSYGRLNVDGAGSVVTSQGGTGRIEVGREGEGHLNVTNGGLVQGFFFDVGRQGDGDGFITVDGVGSRLVSENQFGYFGYGFQYEGGFFRFGRDYGGYGRLDITNGGEVTVKNTDGTIHDIPIASFGRNTGGTGVFNIDGAGSSLNVTMTGSSTDGLQSGFYEGPLLRLGRDGGQGIGTVQNGGEINIEGENARIAVGQGADANGFAARSTLTIQDGGVANVTSLGNEFRAAVFVGDTTNASGRLIVDGAGSQLNIASDNVDDVQSDGVTTSFGAQLHVGSYGNGDLQVTNGGQIYINGSDDAYPGFLVGIFDGSIGSALVSGAGSTVTVYGNAASPTALDDLYNAGAIRVGLRDGSDGTLIIENGGNVTNSATNSLTQIGGDPGSVGRVTVDGAGSALNAGQRLQIGADIVFDATSPTAGGVLPGGTGALTITNGAIVNVESRTDIGVTGTLNLDGTLNAGTVQGLGGFSGLSLLGRINVGGDQAIGFGDINGDVTTSGTAEIAFEFEDLVGAVFDVLELDPTQDPANWAAQTIVLDMSALGAVNVGDTAFFLDWDGAAPDPNIFLQSTFQVVNAPPGVTFNIGEDATTGDWFVEVTNAPNGSISIEGFARRQAEGDTSADNTEYTFKVTRNGDLTQTVNVDFEVVGLGANAADGTDFEGGALPSGVVSFVANQDEAFITLAIAEDSDVELDESFEVRLTGVSGNQVILNSSAIGVIENDDIPAALSINSGISALEDDFGIGGQTLDFTVTRTGDLVGAVDVSFVIDADGATSGSDLNLDLLANPDDLVLGAPQIGTVTIADGQATGTISVEIAADTVIEPREDITVTLTGFSGDPAAFTFGNRVGTGTIINDDGAPPVIPVGLEADIFGDPHLVTLDGLGYDFQAVGEFVLVEDTTGTTPLSVQIRTAPVEGSDLVSVISAMAADMGQGVSLMIDATREPALLVDGVATVVPNTGANPVDVGDGQVFFDGETYTVVFGTGDALTIKVFDGFMNVCVFLDSTSRDPGSVHGLLGDANGETANDFSLRDGSAIPGTEISFDDGADGTPGTGDDVPTLDFDFLYGTYADSWRISDAESLFFYTGVPGDEGTADYTDTNFPRGVLSVDSLPQEILDAAIAAADAAGITDPILRESAILDFALTGDEQFAAGASGVAADPEVETTPAEAPELPATIGITPVTTSIVEGDSGVQTVSFTIYRLGDISSALTVDYAIGGDVDALDFVLGASALSGSVSFVQGEATKTVSLDVIGDQTSELDERIVAAISTTATALIGAPSAITTILTDDLAPIARADGGAIISGSGVVEFSNQLLTANDVDPEGDPIFVTEAGPTSSNGAAVSTPNPGTVRIDQLGIYDSELPGSLLFDSFEYTITDGNGGLDTAQVDLQIGVLDNGTLSGTSDADLIIGSTSNDTIAGQGENDEILAGLGDDVLIGGTGGDTLNGDEGEDTADYSTSADAVFVALSNGAGTGGFAASGDAEGDELFGIEHLLGTAFPDFMRGNELGNTLIGGDGGDFIVGLAGNDSLSGGEGNDALEGGEGDDIIDGGAGDDFYAALGASGPVTIDLLTPSNSSAGFAGDTLIDIEGVLGATDHANTITGSNAALQLIGGDVDDVITGGAAGDVLVGFGGDDSLIGNGGQDLLFGDVGNDTMEGGGAADTFLFVDDGVDVITDFALPPGGTGLIDRVIFFGTSPVFATEIDGSTTVDYGTNGSSVTFQGIAIDDLIPGFDPLTPLADQLPDWLIVS